MVAEKATLQLLIVRSVFACRVAYAMGRANTICDRLFAYHVSYSCVP